ncbi:MAG TPA: MFS transporter [Candidatus Limnocylindria bacterium]|nr:MFS transporter [Candidatus Limnocylindria bacterium]
MTFSVDDAPSYRRLFAIDGFPRLVASMMLARTAGQMVALILVLLALQEYGSAELAGLVTFLAVAPGIVASPIAGALLDRHGRTRLVVLDYFIAAASLALIAGLSAGDALPVPALLLIVTVSSLTQPLSNTGVRTLFPLIVPKHMWERANAIDSNGYIVASIVGPALAGGLVAGLGAPTALAVTASLFAIAGVVAIGLRDPATRTDTGRLLADAWRGLVYVARHPTLRALALSVSTANLGWGIFFLTLPVLVLQEFGGGPEFVGLLFALLGLSGSVAVLLMGRVSTQGRERQLLAGSMLGHAAAFGLILLFPNPIVVAVSMFLLGIVSGPFDIVLFTLRQRRTDPAWLGRAFAVSMALNFAGFPIGSAIAGAVVPISIAAALALAIVFQVVGAVFSMVTIPAKESAQEAAAQVLR